MKNTKFAKSVSEKLDSSKSYGIDEAMSLLMELKRSSFAESVDVAFNLGVDPRHADENIRLSLILPHGIGRSVSVLAIVNSEKEAEAKEAGADFVGSEEYLEKIKSGWTDVDKIVVTPDLMGQLGKLGKVLGPKGLMPNPKSGTVTNDIAKAIKELKAGKLDARVEKNGILQSSIGKTSFSEQELKENFETLRSALMSAKPNSFKGKYLNSISLSSTLGPGIKIGTE
ncbi:50S ribosomal protein L1 [Candidatus Marinimicrobia bacterium]|nr:50S ribosomal protein L1 [Candidatus Neomarinimicrobiota bacterium]MDC0654175.1 50S ribosomal protein L1 [Candidatus Neomarinimicrobiota bacterium]MDC1145601.1 50S ribosomal protein L1 [Candidatus Neomarinimicrobiota bacterium]MDC3287358.1 50S ribosomal protein L1 [Candidatus Neomarinimicrobiota bacterium]|tara:strand:- start:21968 stop:22648 length:681 start_codon:yes stop_codon:yes gene_type:complete